MTVPREIVGPDGRVRVGPCGRVATTGAPCGTCVPCPYYFRARLCNPTVCGGVRGEVYICALASCPELTPAYLVPVADVARSPAGVQVFGGSGGGGGTAFSATNDFSRTPAVVDHSDFVRITNGGWFEVALGPGTLALPNSPFTNDFVFSARRAGGTAGDGTRGHFYIQVKRNGAVLFESAHDGTGLSGYGLDETGAWLDNYEAGQYALSPPYTLDGFSIRFVDATPDGSGVDIDAFESPAFIRNRMQNGTVIRDAGGFCYLVDGNTRFYRRGQAPPGGEEIPDGAVILDSDPYACGPDCSLCTALSGWYLCNAQCPCSQPAFGDPPIFVTCRCLAAMRGTVRCPTFGYTFPDGRRVCVQPSGAVVSELPPDAIVVDCTEAPPPPRYDGCCGCCDPSTCHASLITPYRVDYPGEVQTFAPPQYCCCNNVRGRKRVTGTFKAWNFRGNLVFLLQFDGTVTHGNPQITGVHREWDDGDPAQLVVDEPITLGFGDPCSVATNPFPVQIWNGGFYSVACLEYHSHRSYVDPVGGGHFDRVNEDLDIVVTPNADLCQGNCESVPINRWTTPPYGGGPRGFLAPPALAGGI